MAWRRAAVVTAEWFPGLPAAHAEPVGVDTSVAHPARVYDYWLGGKDNFPADRAAGDAAVEANPDILPGVRANRRFLARAVHYLAGEAGIRQFLDLGTGLPSASNTHKVAQAEASDTRIVYVDNDPIVHAHARALLTSTEEGATAYIDADIRDTEVILREAVERAGQLLGMDAQATADPLERDLSGRVLREEFEDLAIVLAEVAEGVLPHVRRGGDHGARHHDGACT